MDYHIFETYTLTSMLLDLNKEIEKVNNRLNKLKETRDSIDWLVKHRENLNKNPEKIIRDDTLIDPSN